MRTLIHLTIANIRGYSRDRAALFWTFGFPLLFIVLFGGIFQGSRFSVDLGFVDLDHSEASAQLRAAFTANSTVNLTEGDEQTVLDAMRNGKVRGVLELPAGYGSSVSAGTPVSLTLFTDAAQQQQSGSVAQVVGNTLGAINLGGK